MSSGKLSLVFPVPYGVPRLWVYGPEGRCVVRALSRTESRLALRTPGSGLLSRKSTRSMGGAGTTPPSGMSGRGNPTRPGWTPTEEPDRTHTYLRSGAPDEAKNGGQLFE